jgi:ketosteroid isomerase-like protein
MKSSSRPEQSYGRRGELPSEEVRNAVITRVKYSGRPRRSRNLEERLLVRFPSLFRRPAALIQRWLSPRSRLRRALLRRNVVSAYAAFSREDFELILVRFSPDVEYEFNPGLQTLGLGGIFRGHEGMLEAFGKIAEAWESWELEPAYALDLGDRVLLLGFNRSRARGSGVTLEEEFAELNTARDGLVARHQAFFSWDEGLRAAGLDPAVLDVPARGTRQAAVGSG